MIDKIADVPHIDLARSKILLQVVCRIFLSRQVEALMQIEDRLGAVHADLPIHLVAEINHMEALSKQLSDILSSIQVMRRIVIALQHKLGEFSHVQSQNEAIRTARQR